MRKLFFKYLSYVKKWLAKAWAWIFSKDELLRQNKNISETHNRTHADVEPARSLPVQPRPVGSGSEILDEERLDALVDAYMEPETNEIMRQQQLDEANSERDENRAEETLSMDQQMQLIQASNLLTLNSLMQRVAILYNPPKKDAVGTTRERAETSSEKMNPNPHTEGSTSIKPVFYHGLSPRGQQRQHDGVDSAVKQHISVSSDVASQTRGD
jgi:hypothetical protein